MHPDLRQFLVKYLSVVVATLLSVSFFAFLSIPYSLGAHPGEQRLAVDRLPAPTTVADTPRQS